MFGSRRSKVAPAAGTSAPAAAPHHGTVDPAAPGARRGGRGGIKNDIIAALGEFLGTFVFLLLGLAAFQAALVANGGVANAAFVLMASTGMAVAITLAAAVFFRVSHAAFNPNVALALLLAGAIKPVRFVLFVIAQLLGAIAASAVLSGILPGPLRVLCERSNGMSIAQALFFEMFLTAALCLVVLMTAVERHTTTDLSNNTAVERNNTSVERNNTSVERNRTTVLFPLALGFALWATQLAGLLWTGAAVNTARAFGPAVIAGEFVGSHWIYWVGPSLGAILAAVIYRLLVALHYWECVQDATAPSVHDGAHHNTEPARAVKPEYNQSSAV